MKNASSSLQPSDIKPIPKLLAQMALNVIKQSEELKGHGTLCTFLHWWIKEDIWFSNFLSYKTMNQKYSGNLCVLPSALSEKAQRMYQIVEKIVQEVVDWERFISCISGSLHYAVRSNCLEERFIQEVIPLEPQLNKYYEGPNKWSRHPKIEQLKVLLTYVHRMKEKYLQNSWII